MNADITDTFAPYPRTEQDATAVNMYRNALVRAMVAYLETTPYTWPDGPTDRNEQMRRINELIAAWTEAYLLRETLNVAPAFPDDVALDLWTAYEAGDSFGEHIYDWLSQESISPEDIEVAWKASRAGDAA